MYNSHTLPPPSSIVSDHRPLRLTSSAATPQPTGECCFPTGENQRCSCQSFHHNRTVPGSQCDCEHLACFHVHTHSSSLQDGPSTSNHAQIASITALANRVQRLEEAVQQERALRETLLADEQRARERDVRILREALHPFYRSEEEMRRKLVEVEDRIDGTYDEQLRLKDRIVALDDANMALEKRMEDTAASKPKRRRTNNPNTNGINGVSHDSRSDVNEGTSARSSSQGQLSPLAISSGAISPKGPGLLLTEPEEPRSSGILNLVDLPEPPQNVFENGRTPRELTPREEPRSSGFLEISLAERLASKFASPPPRDFATATSVQAFAPQHSLYSREAPAHVLPLISSQIAVATRSNWTPVTEESPTDGSVRKRKWDDELRPLDVLANLSAASPMV